MTTEERVEELEAIVVYLSQKIEKLEGKKRLAPNSSYLKDLSHIAKKMLKHWR